MLILYFRQAIISTFIKEDENGNQFHAHAGDIAQNEALIYGIRKGAPVRLQMGDQVTFRAMAPEPRAIIVLQNP